MTSSLVQPVRSMRPGDHCCVRFGSDEEKSDVVAAYVRDGLVQHDKVAYFCAGHPDEVLDSLAERGVRVGPSIESGQLQVISPHDGYLADSRFDPDAMVARWQGLVAAAHAESFRALRATGEVHALRGRPGSERLLEYERKVAAAFNDSLALGLCQYDERAFPADQIAAAEAAHPQRVGPNPLYSDASLIITPTYAPLGVKMVGEVDMAHGAPDNRVLSTLQGLTHDLHVDLSGLRFLDLAGAWLLAQLAQHLDRHGALLILRGHARPVLSVLRLTGWDRWPNVVIDDPADLPGADLRGSSATARTDRDCLDPCP